MTDSPSSHGHSPKSPGTYPDDAWDLLHPSFTEERRQRMLGVAAKRTNQVRLAIQDIHDPHNVSACMRSAEAMGINHVDVITLKGSFRPTGPSKGTRHWSNIHNWQDVASCTKALKDEGYLLCAGLPRPDAVPLGEIPTDKPVCLLFGNEHEGISDDWLEHVDIGFTIPMVGMVESLNISVAAAISLYDLTRRFRLSLPADSYYITNEQQRLLLNRWAYHQCRDPDSQLAHLRQNAPSGG